MKTALNNQGFYPSVKVLSGALPIVPGTPIIVQNDKDDSSDKDDEDWNPGDDDCDSEGDTSLDTDDENESDKEEENEVL